MSQRQTSVVERNYFIDRKLAGYTLQQIAQETGWSWGCVRLWWRRYRAGGRPALDPPDGRTQRGGTMSRFPEAVRTAFTELKQQHPGWGAPVARQRVAAQLALTEAELPSHSTIEAYWREHQPPLVQAYRAYPPAPSVARPAVRAPHERWQLDFKEWIKVPTLGHIDVLNIRDEATPVKIASVVYPARQATGRDVQATLRTAFTRWGRPDRLQTDRDKRLLNANHAYPFPTAVLLWLAGLGIQHDVAPSAMANGAVERYNRTWYERVVRGAQFESLAALQRTSDQELDALNHELPCRGRACDGRPPLVAYPSASQARRPFSPQLERERFCLPRVYAYLAEQLWWRRVSAVGQISLGGVRYSVGSAYAGQDVQLTFDAQAGQFVVHTAQAQLVTQLVPQGLTVAAIIGPAPTSS